MNHSELATYGNLPHLAFFAACEIAIVQQQIIAIQRE